jgi:hypothetical protein
MGGGNSVAPSLRMNYTDWATTTCRPNLGPTFVDRGVLRHPKNQEVYWWFEMFGFELDMEIYPFWECEMEFKLCGDFDNNGIKKVAEILLQ